MTKNELIASVAAKTGLTKAQGEMAVAAFLDTVTETLAAGDKVAILGFGTFEVREKGERMGTNPKTGEKTMFGPSKTPVFKAGKGLKDSVSKK